MTIDVLNSAPVALAEQMQWAKAMATADMLPRQYRDKPGNVLVAMEYARSLDIPVGQVLAGSVNVIDGKPSMSAQLMQALVRRAGHRIRSGITMEGTPTAWAEVTRADDPGYTYRSEFSMDDAKRAGLLGKDNWKGYPRAMLKSRAVSEVCREACADVLAGIAYVPEELGAWTVDADEAPEPYVAPRTNERPGSSLTVDGPPASGGYQPHGPMNVEPTGVERDAPGGPSPEPPYPPASDMSATEAKRNWWKRHALAVARGDLAAIRKLGTEALKSGWPGADELVAEARSSWAKVNERLSGKGEAVQAAVEPEEAEEEYPATVSGFDPDEDEPVR